MEARVFVACLFVVAVVSGEQAPTGLCRANERFLECGGCQATCQNPAPSCAAVCRTGCYCEEGQVRGKDGLCVNLSECPPIKSAYKQDTSEPRPNGDRCPEDEEYRFCEPCNKTCDNPNPICPAQCSRGCFCKKGLLRDRDGRCVTPKSCSRIPRAVPACKENQVYKQCETQEKTCYVRQPSVPSPCLSGCYCVPGYYKTPEGHCVTLEDCPKGPMKNETVEKTAINMEERRYSQEVHLKTSQETPTLAQVQPMFGVLIYDSQPSHHDPTVEDCAPDEEYFNCGWCEPSCSDPSPSCPNKVCIRGCLCRPPLLRHYTGHCVDVKDCFPEKCMNPNEEYVCLFGCELRCDGVCHRPRYCVLGCYCRIGLLRDNNGHCVIKEKCSNSTEVGSGAVSYDKSTAVNYDKVAAVNFDKGAAVNFGRSTAANFDRDSPVNNDPNRTTPFNHHSATTVDFKKMFANDETFILVPIL